MTPQEITPLQMHELVKNIPEPLVEAILQAGPVEWGATAEQSETAHVEDFRNSLKITREQFHIGEERSLQGVYLKGTSTVMCHTGTSPNSGTNAQIIAGLWNTIYDLLKSAAINRGDAANA